MEMSSKTVYQTLNSTIPGVIALFDPDRMAPEGAGELAKFVSNQGAAGILIGSSLMVTPHFDKFIQMVKKNTNKPAG